MVDLCGVVLAVEVGVDGRVMGQAVLHHRT